MSDENDREVGSQGGRGFIPIDLNITINLNGIPTEEDPSTEGGRGFIPIDLNITVNVNEEDETGRSRTTRRLSRRVRSGGDDPDSDGAGHIPIDVH